MVAMGVAAAPAAAADPVLTSFTATPNPGHNGDRITLTSKTDQSISWRGFQNKIVDLDTGQDLVRCEGGDTCQTTQNIPWDPNTSDRRYRAYLISTTTWSVVSQRDLSVPIEPYDFGLTLSATPQPVNFGTSTEVRATVNRSLAFTGLELRIIDADTGVGLVTCSGGTFCNYYFTPSVLTPGPRRFVAKIVESATSRVQQETALVVQASSGLTLAANPNAGMVGQAVSLTATTATSLGYGAWLKLWDGGNLRAICTSGTVCTAETQIPWTNNIDPDPIQLRADLVRSSNDELLDSQLLEVPIGTQGFDVGLSFADSATSSGVTTWSGQASVAPTVAGTGFAIKVRSTGGTVHASCTSGTSCSASVPPGSYYASVEDVAGSVYGRSSTWTLTAEEAVEEEADGIDLIVAAGGFSTVTEICMALAPYPGTNLMQPPSSATDQQRACWQAEALGVSKHEALRRIAAAAGAAISTTVLYWLLEEALKEPPAADPTTEPTPTPTPTPEPTPVPPVPVDWGDEDTAIQTLLDQNPDTFASTEEARIANRSCLRVASQDDCLRIPVFVPGDLDMPSTTAHNRIAIFKRGQPVLLHWTSARLGSWYSNAANQPNNCSDIESGSGYWCDEYPFKSTQEAGPGASLMPVVESEQRTQAGKITHFYTKCYRQVEGRPFLVAPSPAGSHLPTLPICNGATP